MIKKIIKRLKRSYILIFTILVTVILSICCCSYKPKSFSMLLSIPMEKTSISSYLTIETLYESDKKIIFVISWGQFFKPGNHTLKLEIYNNNGDRIFTTTKKNITIQPDSYFYLPILLNKNTKGSLIPGLITAKLYIDDELAISQKAQYVKKSIINRNIQSAVILPFIETPSDLDWPSATRDVIINTFAHAIYCEVKRIIPDTIPHYVAEQKIGKLLKPDCFNSKECVSFVEDIFGGDIFILGEISIQRLSIGTSILTVYVYNTKTKEVKKYHYFRSFGKTYADVFNDLLFTIMYKKGLLDYLKQL